MKDNLQVDTHLFLSAISQTSPLLPREGVKRFVRKYFHRKDVYASVLSKHSVPLYVLETAILKERAQQFRGAFQRHFDDIACYFAMKSNNHPDVSKILLKEGFGLDVSSGLELKAALSIGARDIVFSGPGKTNEELSLAVDNKDSIIVLVDSFGELDRLNHIAGKRGCVMPIGVRLTTQPKGLWRKFGILPEHLTQFLDTTQHCPNIKFKGFQFHTSWNLSPKAQILFIQKLFRILKKMPQYFKNQVEFIDIGGGYWPEQGEWLRHDGTPAGIVQKAIGKAMPSSLLHYKLASKPIETFAEQLGLVIKNQIQDLLPCRICFEPGRWIVNNAMHLFVSVVDKKDKDLVITDAGTNTIGWERYETDYCPILNLTRPSLKENECLILGSLCTPHDVWGYTYWGKAIEPGDVLMIPEQGAYTYSLHQNFIKPVPDVVSI